LRVKVRMETWQQASSFVTRNLSRGGMFLAMPDAAPPGTLLQMAILLPDGSEVKVRGQIRHAVSRERAQAEGCRAGVGVKFMDLDEETRQRIGKVVDAARTLAEGSATLPVPVPEPPPDETASLLEALRAQLGEMKEQDYFGVLGLDADASADEVDRGLQAQLARWDPDKLADESPELREVVAEIVILLQRAHAVLSDANYRAKLRERTEPEENGRDENGLDESRRDENGLDENGLDENGLDENGLDDLFDDVPSEDAPAAPPKLEIAGTAKLKGLPEPVLLARAARDQGNFEEASKTLAAALTKTPGDRALLLEYHLTMGYGELSRDQTDLAARHFDEVIRINPGHTEAITELRRLSEQPRKAKRALLGRLFHRNGS